MRILFVHADRFEFEARRPAEPGGDAERGDVRTDGRMDDCVAAFVCAERADEADPDGVVAGAAAELRDVTDHLGVARVALSPHAHLCEDPADRDAAKRILRGVAAALEGDGRDVLRAPVGWHTAVEVASRGHPHAEGSRRVRPNAGRDRRRPAESSEWRVLWPDGTAEDAAAATSDLSEDLRRLVEVETDGVASPDDEPAHLELAREAGLATRDDRTDGQRLRWYPRGKLVRDLLAEHVAEVVVDDGGLPVETPAASEGEARLGSGVSRGHLDLLRDADLSAADLPTRLFEFSPETGRREPRRGGGPDPSEPTRPAVTAAAGDDDEARAELLAQARLALRVGEGLDLDYRPTFRVTRTFYDEHRPWMAGAVAEFGGPALVEIAPSDRVTGPVAIDFATVDASGRPLKTATASLDAESAERSGVTYAGADGDRHPAIVHSSPAGSVETLATALLDRATAMDVPRLPTWLAPTQVRFVPVTDDHAARCVDLAADLAERGVRADVDDRDETVGDRIARADSDLVPYYAVVGDPERDGRDLSVTVRATGEDVDVTLPELGDRVLDETEGRPRKRGYLPTLVSEYPDFAGGRG